MKLQSTIALGIAAVVLSVGASIAGPDLTDPKLKPYINGKYYSGYVINDPTTREMQDDDFQNPAFLWVEQAEEEWNKVDGEAQKSCASCHNDPESLKGASTTYPKVDGDKLITVEHRINQCRTQRMKAKAWKWESDAMLGTSALVRMQSRGMPVNVKVDGEAELHFEQGKEFYHQRRGQLDLACIHCHVQNNGNMVRSELLSHGMPNGFPTYRLKWQKLGSLHRRFRGCNKNIRAQPYKQGSPEYTSLELYVMRRAAGLPVESPSVRK